jgi:hypothetical protein
VTTDNGQEDSPPPPPEQERSPTEDLTDPVNSAAGDVLPLGYARPGTERPGMNLVTIATFAQSWEAHLAAGKLEAAGIPAVLADENIVSIGGGIYTGLAGGIKLQVPQVDAERALAELPDRVRVRQVKCPRCGSTDTREVDYTPGLKIFFLLLLGLPYLFTRRPHVCLSCQNVWRSTGIPAAAEDATDTKDD